MTSNHSIGIHGIYTYFPRLYVSQEDCESYDGVGSGKYTIGLGQRSMAIADPQEDIISMAMTACDNLMEQCNLTPNDIGRLEVGTETIVDKSKSIKTHLMEKFNEAGNYDVVGVDTINACYGGTNALFNAVNWIESSMWNGKYAIVLTGDIAIYEKGPARPTGGAGMVAILVGPDAPLILESDTVVSYFEHAYDFYKPNMSSEYPTVDGPLSNECYMRAIEHCYENFRGKVGSQFDYALLHAPYQKLVRKAYHRIYELETQEKKAPKEDSEISYEEKVKPGLGLSLECGNMYTGSVWASLNSLLVSKDVVPDYGKRVMVFSYGSGLASSMFALRMVKPEKISSIGASFEDRLEIRQQVSPEKFHAMVDQRETETTTSSSESTPSVYSGTYIRTNVDSLGRRSYQKTFARAFRTLKRHIHL